ncbi:hypothetical protein X753_21770 [Mesorhizobium sp. LNJC399B00]|uniref:hypothetical protein n=1 Tax=unclassified Mesorhizobium TaxID=325217 RepID=UPI0003CF2F6D|nr:MULTISPECIES: hypothetical protein [unclassified Mesorhizobium]ESY03905.1 hypothetical protein X753_21770 [Mesorhizobium sp. LNJC399B00]WJI68953.1 hypothetical protein NLY36_29965 [Mesorhizobium sp. C399B]
MALSPSLNRAVIDRYQMKDPRAGTVQPDPALDDLAGALDSAGNAAVEIEATAAAITADKTRTAQDNAVRVRAAATTIAQRGVARLDSALERTQAEIGRLTASTWAPAQPRNATEESRAAELRGVLRQMDDKSRAAAIAGRLAAGDDQFLSAVLHADPLLLGMSDVSHASVRDRWRRQKFPVELGRIERLTKAVEAARRAGLAFVEVATRHTQSPPAKLADAAAARAAEAIAAAASHQA